MLHLVQRRDLIFSRQRRATEKRNPKKVRTKGADDVVEDEIASSFIGERIDLSYTISYYYIR